MSQSSETANTVRDDLVAKHLRYGWWFLLAFLSLGITLEAMHGLKIGWYLDVGNQTRRFMWTLGHTHGTLISLIHLAFAASIRSIEVNDERWPGIASSCLTLSTILMPGGFILGGLFFYGGDPGLGVFFVPIGGLFLFAAVFLTARGIQSSS